jgi:DNA-binding MarR family transcriptional regulator
MEFLVDEEGFMAERTIRDLADWYNGDGGDQEAFEAHLVLLKAANLLMTSAQRGRRITLTRERYALLRLLYRAPDKRLFMGDIGRGLDVSPTSVTKLVDGLVALGLLRRYADEQDHRRTWVEIEDEGSKRVEESLPDVKRYTRERWRGLTKEEKRMLIHLLSKLMLSIQSAAVDQRLGDHQLRASEAAPVAAS